MSACVTCGDSFCFCRGVGPTEALGATLQQLAAGSVDPQQALAEVLPYLDSVQQVQDQLQALSVADLPDEQVELLESTQHIALSMATSVLTMATAIAQGDLTTAWDHLRTVAEAEALIGTLQAAAYAQWVAVQDALAEDDVEFEAA